LPRHLHRFLPKYHIRLITRSFPKTTEVLIRLLSRSRGLISFTP
jgi:hypothetical protein